jgi:hypothetical protein
MEVTLGGLINTKGTQRLANLFNNRFSNLNAARKWTSTGVVTVPKTFAGTLGDAFDKDGFNLLRISDSFIAQNASSGANLWPADGNDILYPGATMITTAASNNTSLSFNLPAQITALSAGTMIVKGASVISVDKRGSIPKDTIVAAAPVVTAGSPATLAVTLSQSASNVKSGERICFITGAHQRLVRRWRWYLTHDLKSENDGAIQDAISAALDDADFQSITFQAIEDTQRVVTNIEQQMDASNISFINSFILHLVLLTQKTTAPDPLDPQDS